MPIVFDRQGNEYEVVAEELAELTSSGAYFTEKPKQNEDQSMYKESGGLVTIFDKETGDALQRRPVDARELVKSGKYRFEPVAVKADDAPPQGEAQGNELPSLSDANTKQDIMAALSEHGVQYRANMDKADLLELWNAYVAEQGK